MIRSVNSIKIISITASIFLHLAINFSSYAQSKEEPLHMAIELNNVLCGYSVINISDSLLKGKNFTFLEQTVFANFHMLGKDISQYQRFRYLIDPVSGNFVYHDSHHEQGEIVLESIQKVERDSLAIRSGGNRTSCFIPENTILPNTLLYPYLTRDFNEEGVREQTYQIYDMRVGAIGSRVYKNLGSEVVELDNRLFYALVLEETNPETGMSSKLWIDKDSGMRLKLELPQRMNMYLTDKSVKNKVKTGNYDEVLFVKTNVNIKDLRSISLMKVRIDLSTEPNSTIQDLNIPGQEFIGIVENGEISGICVVAHKRYQGENAPNFPFETDPDDKIGTYLEANNTIESDDPVLVAMAKEIAKGSEDAWEATCRISLWVANTIDGSIADGSARDTFDRKSGLCAAQSNLMAALCRAVGIPARVVWGCMYTPVNGGSFGHHAWNEIYMGDDGWIPVDVTIHEVDYVDSGHIRLGIVNTPRTIIDFREIEILDYEEIDPDARSF